MSDEICGETYDHDEYEPAPGVLWCRRCGAEWSVEDLEDEPCE